MYTFIVFLEKVRFKINRSWFRFIYKRRFNHLSAYATIESPLRLDGTAYMQIEDQVFIHYHTWLGCYPALENEIPLLRIHQGTVIGHYCHISCSNRIIIEKNVLIADQVTITDNTHHYEDISLPIIQQPSGILRNVTIGEGSWIADKCSILGASIGKHCVIGANSVVTKDIPDYSVAAGNPARVIKRYNFQSGKWEKATDQESNH